MAFKFNDRVRVTTWSNEYNCKYRGMFGVVKYVAYTGRYGIELDGLRNANSKMGLFWFDESHLILDKKVEETRINIEETRNALTYMFMNSTYGITIHKDVEITKVIFNNPATIVFWSDGKKTVIKCAGDEAFDEEKGLAMAISKRVLGNQGNYYNEFKKWLPEIEVPCGRKNCDECDDFDCKNTPDDEDKGVSMDEAYRQACETVESFNDAMIKNIMQVCDTCRYSMLSTFSEPCITCNHHERWEKGGK